jgi:cephalosporin-C deacetylase
MPGLTESDLPLEELERYRPERREPTDFDGFWASTLDEAAQHPLDVSVTPLASPLVTLEAFEVSFRGVDGEPVGALLVRPREAAEARPCVVEFCGYTGARGNVLESLAWASAGYVNLVVEPRVSGRALEGLEAPERYHYRRVFANAVRAVRAARELHGVDADRIAVAGASQGGLISLAAAGLAPDAVAAVVAYVPFGCYYERSLRIASEGPYALITEHLRWYRTTIEQAHRTLSYFDGMHFAARSRAPGLFTAALRDPICPPSTVFATANHYGGPHEMRVWPYAGHEGGESDQSMAGIEFVGRTLAA